MRKVYNEVSSDPKTPWQRDSNDGTFWLVFSDFVRLFTKVYLCRVFPDEEYRQYCIHGEHELNKYNARQKVPKAVGRISLEFSR